MLHRITCHVLLGVTNMEMKTEADSNDITKFSHDDKPTIGMFSFLLSFMYVCCFTVFSVLTYFCVLKVSAVSYVLLSVFGPFFQSRSVLLK